MSEAVASSTKSKTTSGSTSKPTPVAGTAGSTLKKTGGKKKGLVRPRGKRGGAKHKKSDSKAAIVGDKQKSKGKEASDERSVEEDDGGKKRQTDQQDSSSSLASKDGKSTKSTKSKPNQKSSKKESDVEPSPHSLSIAAFHMLEKKIARETDPVQKALLIKKRNESGGLEAYQLASQKGAALGESGKWCADTLKELGVVKEEPLTLLDVGALSGTSYSKFTSTIKPTYIDLNPVGDNVIKADFFTYPPPAKEDRFDVVGLSLVVNFVGDLNKRGDMLLHPHSFIKPGGYLYLVLPLACVKNSRYLNHERMTSILSSCGWNVVKQDDSKRLTRWLCKQKDGVAKSVTLLDEGKKKMGNKLGWDGKKWAKEEIVVGARLNNFCIKLG